MSALRSAGLSRFSDPYVLVSTPLSSAKIDPMTFRDELLADPSIKAVTGVERPLWATWSSLLDFTNSPDASSKRLTTQRLAVSYDYFSTMGIKILAGRALGPGDLIDVSDEALAAGKRGPNVVVDRTVAANFGWTDPRQAIGKEIFAHVGSGAGKPIVRPVTIVGVSENAPFQISRSGSSSYVYYLQPDQAALPVIRIDKTKVALALAHIDEVWNALAPTIPLKRSFADEKFEQAVQLFTLIDRTVLGLAVFAVVIASMGLFGVATFITGRRVHEIGVRKTVGATTTQILRLLLWDFSKPVIIANLMAWPVSYVAARVYLNLFVTRVSLTPTPFVASLALTVAIAWAAVANQAIRAARLNPATVLKYE
jgi:putative ABC transport system permease protein